jgi:tagatose-1,6-bisphosphate aldolase
MGEETMKSDAAEIQSALEDINYPKRKEEILEYAKNHSLSEDIMSDLQEISDRTYKSSLDVRDEFKEGRQSGAVRQFARE